jgi:hypothetical protein
MGRRRALRDLGKRVLEAHQMPETSHQLYLLLCASSLDPDTAWAFADVIDEASPVPVAPASDAAPHFPQAEILNASVSKPRQLGTAGVEITLQRLDHDSYLQITTALKMSAQPAHPATGPWQDVPDAHLTSSTGQQRCCWGPWPTTVKFPGTSQAQSSQRSRGASAARASPT